MAIRRNKPCCVVLDTSCVRGTPRTALEAVRRRGHPIKISALALNELCVRFAAKQFGDDSELMQLRKRMLFLAQLGGGKPTFAFTHGPLIERLGGAMPAGFPASPPIAMFDAQLHVVWAELAGVEPLGDSTRQYAQRMAEYVEETGEDFVATSKAAARFGASLPEDRRLMRALSDVVPTAIQCATFRSGPSGKERFDGYSRVMFQEGPNAAARMSGAKPSIEPNHAIDITLLQHLGEGAILATRDYELIEMIESSGSFQAPWVRTIGELILGRGPLGPAFGDDVVKRGRAWKTRSREELRAFDEEGNRIAAAESQNIL